MEWSLGIEHQFGTTASLHAQYVGTRAVNQPYSNTSQRLPNGVPGLFCTIPLSCSLPMPRFAAVTQFSTGANSHYNGLQLTAMKRLGHGLQGQVNYTWSRCMDTVSNGGFLPFSAGGILSPLPGELARDYGPCDYDIRHNLNAQYVYQLPVQSAQSFSGLRAQRLADFRNHVLAQRSSVLGAEHALFSRQSKHWAARRHCAGQWAAVCHCRSRRSAV